MLTTTRRENICRLALLVNDLENLLAGIPVENETPEFLIEAIESYNPHKMKGVHYEEIREIIDATYKN